jgi:hypothetical protein
VAQFTGAQVSPQTVTGGQVLPGTQVSGIVDDTVVQADQFLSFGLDGNYLTGNQAQLVEHSRGSFALLVRDGNCLVGAVGEEASR